MLPYFSIVLPTHNRAHILDKAINSVLKQSFTNFELIIVNDGSADNTEEIVKNYKNDKIKYFSHPKALGVSAARNTAIKNAKGSWLVCLDDDDRFKENILEAYYKIIEESKNPIHLMWTGRSIYTYKKDEIIKIENIIWPLNTKNIIEDVLMEFSTNWGLAINREFILKIGMFDEAMQLYEDCDIVAKAINNKANIYLVDDYLIEVHNYDSVGSLTKNANYSKLAKSMGILIRNNNKLYEQYKPIWKKHNELYLGLSYRALNIKEARAQAKYMFLFNCFNLKFYQLTLKFELLYPIRRFFKKLFKKD